MIGIVLWSDPDDRKAVFWCEDQGDLAYYEDASDPLKGYGFFFAGDMVQFDVTVERQIRKAHEPRLLQENACHDIAGDLTRSAAPVRRQDVPLQAANSQSAEIIPFSLAGQTAKRDRIAVRKA